MTTTVFTPSQITTPPFQFRATFDGQSYNVIFRSNLFGNRWYCYVYALDGTLVMSRALVGSDTGITIQSLSWSEGFAFVTLVDPHRLKTGRVVTLTVTGVSPVGYNGRFPCLVTGPATLRYALATYPGIATIPGAVSYNIDLIGGYFTDSIMVYRTPSNQFDVRP